MPNDPMYDSKLIELAELQNTMRKLLAEYKLCVKCTALTSSLLYEASLQLSIDKLEYEIMKRLHGE